MLRSFLIYLSKAPWARRLVTRWKIAWLVASRFVAGETADDAIRVIRELNAKGICATLDHLGESVTDAEEARRATGEIIEILEEIHRTDVQSGVSIKPSQIGLALDPALFEENLRNILQKAKELNNFVRIDMEDTPYTDVTLATFQKLRQEGFNGQVGIVIQAYLYRSAKDIRQLMETGAPVRLCKGAYKEPADRAFPKKADVDANFDVLSEMLISGSLLAGKPLISACGCFPPIPAIASHDEKRIEHAKTYAQQVGLPKDAIEFQMLNGIRRDLQEQLVAEGYPVRVYVPYGTEWYPYFMRRLAERPANLWFFISNYFKH
ncbi:MAG TPA: proline dehydrogenase [Chloroflexi bacterium]|nr:proline dehydrogenase [Chloroflexota bacterium]HBY09132.1 proline dehydrogenase [Chloroflexota bacterium]